MVGQLVSLLLNVEQSIEEVVKIVVVSNRILSDSQIETLNKIGISYLYEKE